MTKPSSNRFDLLRSLHRLTMTSHRTPLSEIKKLEEQLRYSLLQFGSETPDNLNGVSKLRLQLAESGEDNYWHCGAEICIGDSQVPLDSLLHSLENLVVCSGVPNGMREDFPDLSKEDLIAALRILILLVASLTNIRAEQ